MNKGVIKYLLLLSLALPAACDREIYKDASQPPEKRARDLVRRMTLEEKTGQLLCPLGWPMYEKLSQDSVSITPVFKDFIDRQHGGMLWATFRADPWTGKTLETGLDPVLAAKACNELQRYAIEHSRFGIPLLLAEEAPHGHMAIGTTVFPTGIGLASTWDTGLVRETGRAIGDELRAQGSYAGFGPVIDLARDPRWSRVEETFGEDVYLSSMMGAAMAAGTGLSTLKHFIAYGIPEGGHNGSQSVVGERDLRENFLPAFKAAIDSGAVSVMTSYNTIDGVPSTCNPRLLRDILKGEWGFGGFVVSDLYSIDVIASGHRIASGPEEAGRMALEAGVDVDLGSNCFPLIKEGSKALDEAVYRVLRYKFASGLFDHPYVDPGAVASKVRTPEHIKLAKQAALESVILLKNDGVLPLDRSARIAVIGPNADMMYNQLGDYTAPQDPDNVVTMLEGIRSKAGSVSYVKGCAIRDESRNGIAQAVSAARAAEVAVVVVGGSSARDFRTSYGSTGAAEVESGALSDMESGEGFDRATLGLAGLQNKLLEAVKATGTPMVVVYVEGRPLDKIWASENADALLTLWYPGQEGGDALADVLFGDYNPAGRLPVSVPRSVGQIPVYYNRRFPVAHDYLEMGQAPLYPFGYGLSYTRFEYSDLRLEWPKVSFTITNAGEAEGDEVPQLYITDLLASTARPIKQLRAFDRVTVPAGGSVSVCFTLSDEDLALFDTDMHNVVEPGDFVIAIGASSEDIRLQTIYTRK